MNHPTDPRPALSTRLSPVGAAGPFDPDELVQWAETYGHPEDWAKRAMTAHSRAESLAVNLERLLLELDLAGGTSTGSLSLREAVRAARYCLQAHNTENP